MKRRDIMGDIRGWTTLCNADGNGKWCKRARDGSWYVIRYMDLREWCGESEAGDNFHNCEVLRVKLDEIPAKEMASAIESCGWESMDQYGEMGRVQCCVEYGISAPLWQDFAPSHPERLRANARREAESFMRDASALDSALDRPVNAIGSTARDFGNGDILAGLARHIAGPTFGLDPAKDLVAKIYGVEPHRVQFGTLQPDGTLTDQRSIPQNAMLACPHAIMVPGHYRDDGSCKCDDPAERERMIRDWEYTEDDFKAVPIRRVG